MNGTLLILTALVFDTAMLVLALTFFLAELDIFIDGLAGALFFGWFAFSGVSMARPTLFIPYLLAGVAKFIPLVPSWTIDVAFTIYWTNRMSEREAFAEAG